MAEKCSFFFCLWIQYTILFLNNILNIFSFAIIINTDSTFYNSGGV